MLAFGGTRTFHRLMCAIEDAGWEYRDTLCWMYGSGFPKSYDISKGIDKTPQRNLIDVYKFKTKLKNLFDKCGKSRNEIDSECGFRASNYLSQSNPNKKPDPWVYLLPPKTKWKQIKMVLGIAVGSDIEKQIDIYHTEAERQIIAVETKARSATSQYPMPTLGSDVSYKELSITEASSDKAKQFSGYGTALKPSWEPIIVAMKPTDGTFVNNALTWGVAGLNIDGCRVGFGDGVTKPEYRPNLKNSVYGNATGGGAWKNTDGRWPANTILDEEAAKVLDEQSGTTISKKANKRKGTKKGNFFSTNEVNCEYNDQGGTSRFFYCAKASRSERGDYNNHPTVKPLKLMRYLVRLVKPPIGGLVLDPFAGSGTTALACLAEKISSVSIEKEKDSYKIMRRRITEARNRHDGKDCSSL